MPFRLRSASGPAYPLDRLLYIGRDDTCQIRLPDSLVSRVHAAVWVDRGLVQVRDEHASNGTFVNGTRLSPGQTRTLRPGDQLQIGNRLFTLDGAATSAADMETLVEPPVLAPSAQLPPAPMTMRAAEPLPAPTRAAPLPPSFAAPAAPPRRGLPVLALIGGGCALMLLLGACLLLGFFLTPFGQDLLRQLLGG